MPENGPTTVDKRVAIVEDHQLLAESLAHALTLHGYDVHRVPVPDRAGAPATFVTAITRARPRVVLLDLDLGSFGDGVRLVEPIARTRSHVVVLTGSTDRARWGQAIFHGARVVLSKTDPLNNIISSVRRINEGLPVLSADQRKEMVDHWRRSAALTAATRAKLDSLTAREAAVLGHLMSGMTVRDVAVVSAVAEATVRSQVKALLAKLEVSSQVAAIGLAYGVGWSAPEAG